MWTSSWRRSSDLPLLLPKVERVCIYWLTFSTILNMKVTEKSKRSPTSCSHKILRNHLSNSFYISFQKDSSLKFQFTKCSFYVKKSTFWSEFSKASPNVPKMTKLTVPKCHSAEKNLMLLEENFRIEPMSK